MGQNGSCIQGSVHFADEESTYTNASSFPVLSSTNTELLKHLTRRLSASDRHSKENIYGPLPKSRACPRHGNTLPQERRQNQQRLDTRTSYSLQTSHRKPAPAMPPLNDSSKGPLYKETFCKRVNFSEFSPLSAKDQKTVSLKPAISKNGCRVHGHGAQERQQGAIARNILQPSTNSVQNIASHRQRDLSCQGKVEQKNKTCPVHATSSRMQTSHSNSSSLAPLVPPPHSKQRSSLSLEDSFSSPLFSEGPFPRTSTPTKSIASSRVHSSHIKQVRFPMIENTSRSSSTIPENSGLPNRQRQAPPPPYRFPPARQSQCPKPESQDQVETKEDKVCNLIIETSDNNSPKIEFTASEHSEDDNDSGVFISDEESYPSVQESLVTSAQNVPQELPSSEKNSEDNQAVKKDTSLNSCYTDTDDLIPAPLSKDSSLDSPNNFCLLHWLKDVKASRGKGMKKDPELVSALSVYNSRETIELLEEKAEEIVEKFSQALKQLDQEDWVSFYNISSELCTDVEGVLRNYGLFETAEQASEKAEVRNHATDACHGLSDLLTREKDKILVGEKKEVAMKSLKALGETLHEAMEFLLGQEITVIVSGVKEGGVGYCAKLAVETLIELAKSGELMSRLITKVGGTRTLLAIYAEENRRFLRPLVLRTLNALCSSPDTISEMEKARGTSRILEILCEEGESEEVRSEAVGLLAQITASRSDNTSQTLTAYSSQLVKTLIGLAHNTKSSELFLLITTVLANMAVFSTEFEDMVKQQFTLGNSFLASHLISETRCPSDEQQEMFTTISSAFAMDKLSSLNATDLVKAKLWDFLMLCSSRQESYV